MFVGIFFLCFLVLTPTYVIGLLQPMQTRMSEWVDDYGFLVEAITNYFQPLLVILVNSVLIPWIVNTAILYEDYIRHSTVLNGVILRLFFFQLLNTLLIPLTTTSSALAIFEKAKTQSMDEWPTMISSGMMSQQTFYIKFMISLTFITNGLTLIDAPHRILSWFNRKIYERKNKHLIHIQSYKDV